METQTSRTSSRLRYLRRRFPPSGCRQAPLLERRETNSRNPSTNVLYHGTSAGLFGRFSLDHALEGAGKVKFGWGVYVTESYDSAFLYARKSQKMHPENGCFVYKVEVPGLTPDNHLAFGEPVHPSIVARVGKKLGVDIPARVTADGKDFRKFIACQLGGTKKPTLAGEKAVAEFLDRLGVVCIVWPYNWKKDEEGRFQPPFNRAVFNADRIRVVSVNSLDKAGNIIERIHGSQLPR